MQTARRLTAAAVLAALALGAAACGDGADAIEPLAAPSPTATATAVPSPAATATASQDSQETGWPTPGSATPATRATRSRPTSRSWAPAAGSWPARSTGST